MSQVGPQVNMSGDTELLWLAAVLLLLLGATTGLCARCFHPGVKRAEKIYQQRNVQEHGESFEVAQTFTLVKQVCPGPLKEVAVPSSNPHPTHSTGRMSCSSPAMRIPAPSGSQREPDATYIEFMAADDYNWGRLQKSCGVGSSDGNSSDGNSYENVLIFQPRTPDPGELSIGTQAGEGPGGRPSPLCPTDGEESDYQNSTSIYQWHESARTLGQVWGAVCRIPAGSPDNDEPDYVNA
ncbi:linker for activation of T-cells family member 2 isoform X1 [Dipodomys spectabilis]|uniref:linker for activation of T-cells family member 2 isoform X1 n=1 Tax=Dipodomys spectabilis TaxID=105255 RepID=UPI001C53F2DB|nr:linker for activation of T-cells family member 2 isoform X1 [Dipodomys spectabilis]XP_042543986.1 linker for activation of T-cells family member 2 isoform X1 [Dipodomys spectabilis]